MRKSKNIDVPAKPILLEWLSTHKFLLLLLSIGFCLRVWNITWGLPEIHEEAIPLRFGMKLWKIDQGTFDYHFFVYPSLNYFIHFLVQAIHFGLGHLFGIYDSVSTFLWVYSKNPTSFVILARLITVIFDLGTIVVSYLMVREQFGKLASILVAVFLSINLLHVTQAHLVNVDTPLVCFSVLTLHFLYRLYHEHKRKWYLFAGLFIGLAAASKYNGAILVFALVGAHLLRSTKLRQSFRSLLDPNLISALFISSVVFAVLNPLIFFHLDEFLLKFRTVESHMEAGHLGLDPNMSTLSFYFLNSLPANLGWFFTAISMVSCVILGITRDRKYWLLFLIPSVYLALLLSWQMRADRYIFPMIPFMVIIGILGILNISDRLSRFFLSQGPAGFLVKYFKVLGAALFAVLLFPMVSGVWSYNRSIALPDTRTAAAQWINQNARKGSAIATGPFGVELSDSIYISLPIQFSAVASERMAPFYDTRWYEDVDLLIASDFDLGRYRLDPIRYHEMLGFYDSLRSSWELVKEITPNENLTGPSIWMFRSKGSANIGIFPHELTERLRLAELESTRKVDFLGKLGLILLLKGKLYKSEQVFSELLKIDPQNPEAKRAISQVRIQLAQANSGGSNVSSVATHQEVVDSLVLRAENLLQQNRFGEAETLYLQVLNLDRTVDAAYESLMVIYAAQNEKGRVIQILRKYIAVLPPGGERYRLVEEQLKQLERSDE